ncbi:amidohydrolase family protein [Kitasatospora paracochleata]|uniref:Cytosine/adenosine deaminase-related metal-dependent hydrolase n=1 Tax=Kitasatospora paracochleata TaxID=58354 RepID=A0ABT1JCV3_9ACTN|nr:amidohydrolase family protein [Kitasatospora paracochleata]MCP2314546.1 cytosine/adenosine deaminase-related metal-dependent hydrolase [Kitasatospora paracochleata]
MQHLVHRSTDTDRPALLDRLRATAGDRERRVLFTGATILTMDPALGTLERGDLLVTGSTITAVGPDLKAAGAADNAIVVDAGGTLLAPGFVDTHRHAWQAQLRRTIPDVDDLAGYLATTLAGCAPAYRPEDMYTGTRLAALGAVDAGITTMLDFSHNSRSAAHSDAAVQALLDTGIRGVHAAMAPHFGSWDRQWPADLARLRDRYADPLLTFRLAALATPEIAGPDLAFGPELACFARELGIGVSVDAVFGEASSRAILDWERAGLLDEQVSLIHATGLGPDAWRAIAASGATVSLAPTSEPQIGLESAVPAVDEALAVGVRPGLSIDVEVALAGDMFTQMRALLAIQRMRAVNAAYLAGDSGPVPQRIGTADVLDFATLQGARTCGLDRVTGSLTPGKQADLLLLTADELNNLPLNDPTGTAVLGCDTRNIDTVLIAGQVRKWAGRVLDVDLPALRAEASASRDRILRAAAGHQQD